MATKIGDLVVRIGADTSDMSKGMVKAKAQINQLSREAKQGGKALAGYAIAATAAGAAIAAALVVKGLAAVDVQGKLAKQIDGSVNSVKVLTRVYADAGLTAKELDVSQRKLLMSIGEAREGIGPAADAIKKLKLNTEELMRLDADERFAVIADAITQYGDAADQATIAGDLFGSRTGTKLAPALASAGTQVVKLNKEMVDLGLTIDDLAASKVELANDQMDRLTDIMNGVAEQMAIQSAPFLTAIADGMLAVAKESGGVDTMVENAFNNIIDAAGFVVDAVAGVDRVFEVSGKAIAVFGLAVTDGMLTASESIINGPVRAANELIELLNSIPGIDIPTIGLTDFGKTIQDQMQIVRRATKEGMADIAATIAAPLPSKQFDNFVAASIEANNTILENQKSTMEKKLEAQSTEDIFLDELLAESNLSRNMALREASNAAITIAEQEAAAKRAILGDSLNNLATLMQSGSRKMFEIGKIAAIASTVISTYRGAQAAFTGMVETIPGPAGIAAGTAAAGAAIAAGFVRVQAINSTSMGSKAGAAGRGGAGAQAGGTVSSGGGETQQQISVQGINRDDFFSGGQLIDLINEAQDNGARLVIA